MVGWLRRNWIPIVGMAVAVAFVAWLGWINLRGGGSGVASTATGSVSPSGAVGATTTASPTADPAQAQVEAAAKRWVTEYYQSYRTADASALDALAAPGSQAAGEAGAPRTDVLQSHRTILLGQITFEMVRVDVTAPTATAQVQYTTVGTPAAWPSLAVTGPPETKHWTAHIELTLAEGKWLIASFA
jgi:hypothetical protein